MWIGGRKNSRGRWKWEWTESRVSRAVMWGWAYNYPRDNSNECLVIRGRGEVGGLKTWEDASCLDKNLFICEYLWYSVNLSAVNSAHYDFVRLEELMAASDTRKPRQEQEKKKKHKRHEQ